MSHTSRLVPVLATVRTIFDVLVLVALVAWALVSFPLPWPGILAAVLVAVTVILVWALFLSARPVLRADRFLRALVALLFIGAGLAAALAVGLHWAAAAVLFVAAVTVSYFDVIAATK